LNLILLLSFTNSPQGNNAVNPKKTQKVTKPFGFEPTHECTGLFWVWGRPRKIQTIKPLFKNTKNPRPLVLGCDQESLILDIVDFC